LIPIDGLVASVATDWPLVIATGAGSLALALGGFFAYRQLRTITSQAKQAEQTRKEELVLHLAVVYHDILPPKRQMAARLLLRLLRDNHRDRLCTQQPSAEELNALADLVRFFETVYVSIRNIRSEMDRDGFPTDSVALEFGRYAAGYACALLMLDPHRPRQFRGPEDAEVRRVASELLWLTLPRHPIPWVFRSLKVIHEHAEGVAHAISGESDQDPPGNREFTDFSRWTEGAVFEFLKREAAAKLATELTQPSSPRRSFQIWPRRRVSG
jgi:hypothetical protein